MGAQNSNSDFLEDYANVLQETEQLENAKTILRQAILLSNSYEANRKIGMIYARQDSFKLAEYYLKKAVYTIPNKFKATQALLQLYVQNNDTTNIKLWALYIINKPEKVASLTTKSIKNEATQILTTH